jgi:hypothetical protein
MVYPFSVRRLITNEHDGTRPILHLTTYPFPNGLVTLFCDRFPIIIWRWSITLDNTNIAGLTCAPRVWVVMKATEDLSFGRHAVSLLT